MHFIEIGIYNQYRGLLKKSSHAGTLKVANASIMYVPPVPRPEAYSFECFAKDVEAKDGPGKKSGTIHVILAVLYVYHVDYRPIPADYYN